MKRLILIVGLLTLVVSTSFGATGIVGKNGQVVKISDYTPGTNSTVRTDFEYNTGGSIDFVPDATGSWDGWGSHFMGFVNNNTGQDIYLTELGFPCAGPIASSWFVSIGGMPGGLSFDFTGPLTIVDQGETSPPNVYSYADLSQTGIAAPPGVDIYFGYINPGLGGQTLFNGVDTWAWYLGEWDPDQGWGRTAILQLKASFEDPVAIENETFGAIKALYR